MKYEIEKRLHEIIRDLPDCQRIESSLKRGLITTAEALEAVAKVVREEVSKKEIP